MPTGLGDELIWISPTITGSGPASDITGGNTVTEQGTVSNVYDSTEGGKRALSVSSAGDQFYFDWPYITAGNIETFSFWIKKSVLNLTYGYWKVQNGNDSHDAGNWNISDYGTAFGFFGIGSFSLGSQIPANDWTNVIITRDDTASGQQTTIYVDNVQVFQGNTSIGNRYRDQITRIGITSDITTTAEVRFDDVRIFDRIITASERTHLATRRGILGPPAKGLGDEKLWLCPSLQDSANDLSKGNNNGTYNGGMGTISDSSKGGSRCYSFDGVDDYINCGNVFNPAASFSISYWVNFDAFGQRMIISKNWDGTSEPYISRLDSDGTFRFYTYSGSFYGTTVSNPFTTGTWACVTNVYNGSTWAIYVNGSKIAETTQTQAAINNTSDLYIGDTSVGGWNFDGLMDDIRFFDRALTQEEITHLASSRGVQGHPTIKGLGDEKLWLCPSLNDSANDISGNANHGAYNGGMTTIADTSNGGSLAYNMSTTATSRIALPASFDSIIFSDSSVCGWFKYSGPIFNADPNMALIGSSSTGGQWYTAQRGNNTGNQTGSYRTYADDGSNNGDSAVVGTGNEEDNAWHHVAFVRNYTTSIGTVYLDGISIGSAAFTSNRLTETQDLFVGYGLGGYAGNLAASSESLYFDDIRAYSRVLTQEEITHLAKSRGVLGGPYNLNGIKHLLSSFIHPLG